MVPKRSEIKPGQLVEFIQKHHQRSGELTEGIVMRILTKSPEHPHGIKIMTEDRLVGRVQSILEEE
ncbi:MAG: YwbE family protein [Fluviicola sp.]|nr:YwbE family protein [Fluviicola sp.]